MAIRRKSKKKKRARQAQRRNSAENLRLRRKLAKSQKRLAKAKQQIREAKRATRSARTKARQSTKLAKRASRSTKKATNAARKRSKKALQTRKPPKALKVLKAPPRKRGSRKKKQQHIKRETKPPFIKRVIKGRGGELVKIIAPVSYSDYIKGLARLENSPAYKLLRSQYDFVGYSIFGHPGHKTFPSLEVMQAFFETVYQPYVNALNSSRKTRSEFFGNLVIYAVKRSYHPAPRLPRGKRRTRKNRRRL